MGLSLPTQPERPTRQLDHLKPETSRRPLPLLGVQGRRDALLQTFQAQSPSLAGFQVSPEVLVSHIGGGHA